MLAPYTKSLMRGVPFNVVSAAGNGKNDDSNSYQFGIPPQGNLLQVQFTVKPSTGTVSDVTTCSPDLYALVGTVWQKVTTINLVAIPSQLQSVIGGGIYKLTFVNTALVTANAATVNIEARLG